MQQLILTNKELELNFSNGDFVLKTQLQIAKDLGTARIDFPEDFLSTPFPIDQLLDEISIRLKELNSSSSSAFSQVLYRIDIPESMLDNLTRSENFYSALAEIVLKREAYKVFLRSKFSS